MIPATDFPVAGLPAMGSSVLSNAASISDCSRESVMTSFCAGLLRDGSFVSSVLKLAYATAENTVRGSIDRLLWEPCHSYAVLRQECSTSVWGHRPCHVQVSSVLQQSMVDDRLLVVVGTQHHDSHHKTVLEDCCFEINVEKIPTFAVCHLATHPNSRSSRRRRICLQVILLFVLETLSIPISPLP